MEPFEDSQCPRCAVLQSRQQGGAAIEAKSTLSEGRMKGWEQGSGIEIRDSNVILKSEGGRVFEFTKWNIHPTSST